MAHAAQKGMMRFGCLERVGVGGRKSVMGEAVSFFFHLYFSTWMLLWLNTSLRPQTPTPCGTTELSTNLTAWV